MAKAKFLWRNKDRYSNHVYLGYEYRGHEYMICDYGWSGYMNSSLAEQHRNAQREIDEQIEREAQQAQQPQNGNPPDWNEIFEMLGWDDLVNKEV